MRLGVFGGTFDPIHNGHLAVAKSALEELGLDQILFMVAGRPWQKEMQKEMQKEQKAGFTLSSAEDRLAMVRAAVVDMPEFEVSELEIKREGPSYMADTLKELNEHNPEAELFLILGADVANELNTWERPDEVRERAEIVVVKRPNKKGRQNKVKLPDGWNAINIEGPNLDIAGTDIRERLKAGSSVQSLLPNSVIKVIKERKLYESSAE